jgi:hypothetical protein
MKFPDFYKKFKKEAYDASLEPYKTEETERRIVNAWMVHQTIETNKGLVYATWALAIGTLILSGLTIYFQYIKTLIPLT